VLFSQAKGGKQQSRRSGRLGLPVVMFITGVLPSPAAALCRTQRVPLNVYCVWHEPVLAKRSYSV
jgi:hypothetical protein